MSKKIKGKIGYCSNQFIPNLQHIAGGHYVYIRSIKGKKCDVNIITSLEDKNHNFANRKLIKVKKGYVYPIPIKDANFNRWSGVSTSVLKDVDVSKIQNIGCKRIKHRHKFFIGKKFKEKKRHIT